MQTKGDRRRAIMREATRSRILAERRYEARTEELEPDRVSSKLDTQVYIVLCLLRAVTAVCRSIPDLDFCTRSGCKISFELFRRNCTTSNETYAFRRVVKRVKSESGSTQVI